MTPAALQISTDDTLRRALDTRPLSAWRDNLDAVPQRVARALEHAAARIPGDDPQGPATTVAIRRGTLADEAAVRAWLAEHEKKLIEAARKGPVIVS